MKKSKMFKKLKQKIKISKKNTFFPSQDQRDECEWSEGCAASLASLKLLRAVSSSLPTRSAAF